MASSGEEVRGERGVDGHMIRVGGRCLVVGLSVIEQRERAYWYF